MTTIEEIPKECQTCEHLTKKSGFYVCGSQCGKPANCGHPLAPCVLWSCDEDPDTLEPLTPNCEEDEDAILEGGRCYAYLTWLHAMHHEEAKRHPCIVCKNPASYDMGSIDSPKYLCEKCLNDIVAGAKE